jgi:hypothetical protein
MLNLNTELATDRGKMEFPLHSSISANSRQILARRARNGVCSEYALKRVFYLVVVGHNAAALTGSEPVTIRGFTHGGDRH